MLFVLETIYMFAAILMISFVEYGFLPQRLSIKKEDALYLLCQFVIGLFGICLGLKLIASIGLVFVPADAGLKTAVVLTLILFFSFSLAIFLFSARVWNGFLPHTSEISRSYVIGSSAFKAAYIIGFVHFLSSTTYRFLVEHFPELVSVH